MVIQDQSRVIAFLAAPATHGVTSVERIETHASIVFLAGTRAYKLKRAVRYDYLDFGSAERRREMCEAELRINRRTAPQLYVGVVAITDQAGSLHLGGDGTPVDWVVEMVRFDQAQLLDRRAESASLDLDLMPQLGEVIAAFHAGAFSGGSHGGWDGMKLVVDGNAAAFAAEGAGVLDPTTCRQLTHRTHLALGAGSALLDSRRADGLVRQCHGDLHLRNVVLLDGRPVLFDAIEFNDDIACIDVLYDLAFLLMDLWRRRLYSHANAVWNSYLAITGDLDGLPLMPLFLSCRAAVRTKTSLASAALQTDDHQRRQLREMARDYSQLALNFLHPQPARVIAIGGLSGSGKSTLAAALAPFAGRAPGAVILRSDRIRKELAKATPLAPLGPGGYTAEMSQRVYATILERADLIARGGQTVIVDAVFAREGDRDAIQHAAKAAGVPFVGLWLAAPEPVLAARVEARVADLSDADAQVVRQQFAADTGEIRWHRLDAAKAKAHVRQVAFELTSSPSPD